MTADVYYCERDVDEESVPTRRRGPVAAILLATCALMAIGIVMVASASASLDRPLFGTGMWRTVFGRQLVFVVGALVLLGLTAKLARPLLSWRPVRWILPLGVFVVVAVALLATLLPGVGVERGGSQRWLALGPASWGLGFQPSELAKLALIGLLAAWFARRGHDPRSLLSGFLPGAACVGFSVALVGLADFGTAALIGVVGALMLFTAGCRWQYLAVLAVLGMAGAAALVWAAPYRVQRLTAFNHLWEDPQGKGYHAVQSLTTIASGGWTGTGLGAGVQKYGYVPESRTDFIFSVLCEETGVLGGLVVLGLYSVLVWAGLRVVQHACSRFERLLAFGITATVGLQAVMHVAVVTVVAPTTGISLPLVSAGGTGVVTFAVALGLLAAMAARCRCEPK